jgi:hypothetical protein
MFKSGYFGTVTALRRSCQPLGIFEAREEKTEIFQALAVEVRMRQNYP